ncbi:MAG: efflux transporter outer membrane subunit [Rhizobium sp.]|nr:MAG: efflux transporter outer membrane subunit [Rhizobium sp.]
MKAIQSIGVSALSLSLISCAVGPDFKAPATQAGDRYTAKALPAQTASTDVAGGAAQSFQPGGDIPAQWWKLFGSDKLQALVEQALKANPNVEAAQATLRAAHETALASASGLFPAVDGQLGASRQKISNAPAPGTTIYNVLNAGVNVTYTLDVFGSQRRKIESANAQAEYQAYQLEATYLSLSANVVTTAIREASLRAQIDATEKVLAASRRQLEILQRQFDLGGASKTDLLTQQTQLAQLMASLPPLQKQLEQNRNLLAVLLGQLPSQAIGAQFELADLKLPEELPLSLPSKLVEQRPDIRAQEALVHQASAQVGVATANMLPQLTISGSFGQAAPNMGDLFTSGSNVWSIGAGLTQPIFHAGELTHQRRAAVATYEQSVAQYRATVNVAFQNVADALTAIAADAETLKAQQQAYQAAEAAHDIAGKQYKAGGISYTALLTTERNYQQAAVALAQAQADRYADTAALFQALGGGWWNRDEQRNSGNAAVASNPPASNGDTSNAQSK